MPGDIAAKDSPLRVGAIIAEKYRLVGVLGRGGMGTVYEAVHTTIGKHVALKFLESQVERSGQSRARFEREAQTASLVESPHVVHIFDSGCTSDGTPFMVLELLRGEDLRALLRREGRLSIEHAVTVCEQTLRALVRTHAAGIVHRDLKPENIFLCDHGDESIFVKVLDFGISKGTRSDANLDTLTHEGVVLGTAYYMSPEQARGETDIDGRSDIYALGSILFEMLVGRTPYVGNVYHAVLVDICTRDAVDVRTLAPQVPEGLASIIARALSRAREARYPSAQAFLEALAPFAQSHASSAEDLRRLSSTRVSQPAAIRQSASSRSRAGRSIALLFLLSIALSAVLIVVVHKRLKAAQARERAMLESGVSAPNAVVPSQPSVSNLRTPVAYTPVSAPPTTSSAPPGGSAHRTGESGILPHKTPVPRTSASSSDELKLKTEMP